MATSTVELRIFRDRREAGRLLADAVRGLALNDPVVLGLPRGGVPVAYEVARTLDAPLDVLVARKIGAPANPEFAIGAVAEGGIEVLDHDSIRALMISHAELEHAIEQARAQLHERAQRYREDAGPVPVEGRTAVIVDDGLATGATARAAVRAVRALRPRRVVLAVPVGAPESLARLRAEADDVVCVQEPEALWAIGFWYERFGQTPDAEVIELLRRARQNRHAADPADPPADPPLRRPVEIPVASLDRPLHGDLVVPERPAGVVMFAHGSGSSRHSPRNRHVAEVLNDAGLATLLLDLLTPQEELNRRNVFDVELLAQRLIASTSWASTQPELASLPVGYFGASTGAAAALWAAADAGAGIAAIVSRGGRPDLAWPRLGDVTAPTLLIVGSRDPIVLDLNRQAQARMRCPTDLAIVPDATHLFEEPGALHEVSRLATTWFTRHLELG
jgi:putative phosphoribosyl transferase